MSPSVAPIRRTARRWALGTVKATAAGWDRVRRPPEGVTILLYHRVGRRTPVEVDLPSEVFDEQMAWLAAHHTVVSLDDAVGVLAGATAPGPDLVAVTFDDGTADFAEVTVPILTRHGVPATLYLATAFVDEQRDFPDDGRPVSWSALSDMLSTGLVAIGSHTHTHRLLDRADTTVVADELDRSIGLIADRLGVAAHHFAYPKAVPGNGGADRLVRDRFRSAALAGNRANVPGATDVYRLARSAIQVADGQRWFRAKARGGLSAEGALRSLLNRRRYVDAVT